MKKYITKKGFKYKDDANDMIHKQFYMSSVVYENSETSVLNGKILDRVETYILFLKDIDTAQFKTTLESIINTALADGINVSLANTILAERQENGYLVTMEFLIQG